MGQKGLGLDLYIVGSERALHVVYRHGPLTCVGYITHFFLLMPLPIMHIEKPWGREDLKPMLIIVIYYNEAKVKPTVSYNILHRHENQDNSAWILLPSFQDVLTTKLLPGEWTWAVQSTGYIITHPSCHSYLPSA